MLRLRPLLLSLTLVAAACPAASALAGSARATLAVSPHVVKVSQKVTVRASHLKPKATYILLYKPTARKALQRLLAAAQADTHGAYAKALKLPAIGYCGPATIYLLSTTSVVAKTAITVVCPKTSTKAPPPPPHK